jgi:hypothetical protein
MEQDHLFLNNINLLKISIINLIYKIYKFECDLMFFLNKDMFYLYIINTC